MLLKYKRFFRHYKNCAKSFHKLFCNSPTIFLRTHPPLAGHLFHDKEYRLADIYHAIAQARGYKDWESLKKTLIYNLALMESNYESFKTGPQYQDYLRGIAKIREAEKYLAFNFLLASEWIINHRIKCAGLDFSGLDFSIYAETVIDFATSFSCFDLSYCNFSEGKFLNHSFAFAKCCYGNFNSAIFAAEKENPDQLGKAELAEWIAEIGHMPIGTTMADFEKADFTGADCSNACFIGAYMRNANFSHANLQGADLSSIFDSIKH